MKILTILGARPQFIKAACLSRTFKNHPIIKEIILHTGQHYDQKMSEIFFRELQLPKPTYHLKCTQKNRFKMIGTMLKDIEEIMYRQKPDASLVYGDTNSTLAGALASFKLGIPIIHIEAGLRSFNSQMPEETNRIFTDKLSTLLFCPTKQAITNLENETSLQENNMQKRHIFLCGDIMQDNALHYAPYAKKPAISIKSKFILATLHRAQNTDNPKRLGSILEALKTIASHTQVIFPVHPRTLQALNASHLNSAPLTFTPPVSYLETLWLLKHSQAVFTDSGGLQKESYFFKKPCFILREESEWEELIQTRCAILVGAEKEKIIQSFGNMPYLFTKHFPSDLYGNGNAGKIIVEKILETL
ncbi:UDP-N-acetylglucosamine 2-epimerase [Helicobacter sp. 12S02232-10]|nr:UDP-N-acetylglucosamine 2-epimerase [Helicobacter sp. 12S02232-10]